MHAAEERLEELGSLRSLSALNEKMVLLRLLGRLDEAMVVANEAVRQARFTGDREQLLGARIRRAQVLQYQGKADEAVVELTSCADEAQGRGWTALEAFAVQNRGKVYFDVKDYDNALADMTAAVFLREKMGASPAEIEGALTAVAVVQGLRDADRGNATGAGNDNPGGSKDDGSDQP